MLLHRVLLSALSVLMMMPIAAHSQTPIAPAPTSISSGSSTIARSPTVANLLPVDTAGVLLLDTNPAIWESLSRFGLFPKDISFPGVLYSIDPGINFHTDVQPWLGDQIAIALLPAKTSDSTSANRSVVVSSVKDATQIPNFLERLKAARRKSMIASQSSPELIERLYKGIAVLEWKPQKLTPNCQPSKPESTSMPRNNSANTQKPLCRSSRPLTRIINSFSSAAKSQISPAPLPNSLASHSETTEPEQTEAFASPGLAIAVLPGYVVTSTTATAIEQLIDAQAEGKPLSANPLFQRAIQKRDTQRSALKGAARQPLILGYGDYTQILIAATEANQAQYKNLPPSFSALAALNPTAMDVLAKYYDTIDGSLWAEPDGLHTEISVHFKQAVPQSLLDSVTTSNQVLERLPEVSYVVSNSQNLALFWRTLTAGLESEPSLKKGLEQFRQYGQTLLGFDDRDVFSWMTGEYATFMYPTRQGFVPATFPDLDLAFGMMVQTRDRVAAETAFSKFDQAARTRIGQEVVNARKLQGQSVVTWEMPTRGKLRSFLAHGWVAEDTILLLMGGGSITEFSPKPLRSLTQSANFKAAIAPFSDSNLGYFYVNTGAVMSLVNYSVLPSFTGGNPQGSAVFDEMKATLGSVRSISGAGSITANKIQSDGFLALATTRTAPISASELMELGAQKLAKSDVEGAIGNFTRVLELEPKNAMAFSQRGNARLQLEDSRGAIADYTQALRLEPNTAKTYQDRADAYSSVFDYSKALEDWNQALQLNSEIADSYVSRATVRSYLEDYKGAIADADQALRLNSENSAAYRARCQARARGLKDFKGALADCKSAIELDPESELSYASRCYVRANLGDKKALEDCDLAWELSSESEEVYEYRGLAHAALRNPKAALEDLQKAAELSQQRGDTAAQQRVEKAILSVQ